MAEFQSLHTMLFLDSCAFSILPAHFTPWRQRIFRIDGNHSASCRSGRQPPVSQHDTGNGAAPRAPNLSGADTDHHITEFSANHGQHT